MKVVAKIIDSTNRKIKVIALIKSYQNKIQVLLVHLLFCLSIKLILLINSKILEINKKFSILIYQDFLSMKNK